MVSLVEHWIEKPSTSRAEGLFMPKQDTLPGGSLPISPDDQKDRRASILIPQNTHCGVSLQNVDRKRTITPVIGLERSDKRHTPLSASYPPKNANFGPSLPIVGVFPW